MPGLAFLAALPATSERSGAAVVDALQLTNRGQPPVGVPGQVKVDAVLAFAGSDDVITTAGYTTRIGPLVAERRTDLERLGWTVRLVDKARHDLFTRPEVVCTPRAGLSGPNLVASVRRTLNLRAWSLEPEALR